MFLDGGHGFDDKHVAEFLLHLLILMELILILTFPIGMLINLHLPSRFLKGDIDLQKLPFPILHLPNFPVHELNECFTVETGHMVLLLFNSKLINQKAYDNNIISTCINSRWRGTNTKQPQSPMHHVFHL